MRADGKVLLISIRPRFADLILGGSKTVELRRIRPAVDEGDRVLLYASSPVRELIGSCTVAGVDVGSADELWKSHGDHSGVSRSEFDHYFEGAVRAVGISLREPRRVRRPRTLAELRRRLPGFSPPQSFGYLSAEEVDRLDIELDPLARDAKLRPMESAALTRWRTGGLARLAELEGVHANLVGSGAGRKWGTTQLNRSLFLALVAQFQSYCRDLHDEAARVHVDAAIPGQKQTLHLLIRQGRRLDTHNPRYWSRATGYDGAVYDSDFEPECLFDTLPAMRLLIADDALRALAARDRGPRGDGHRHWVKYMQLFDLWWAALDAEEALR